MPSIFDVVTNLLTNFSFSQVVYTRPLVPDASITSEMGDFIHHPQFVRHQQEHNNLEQLMAKINTLQQNLPTLPNLGILKNKHQHPSRHIQHHVESPLLPRTAGKRAPLKSVLTENMKVVRHQPAQQIDCHNQSPVPAAAVNHMYDLMKKHDQQLDFISRQIQQLLDLSPNSSKPVMCSAETMTTNSLLCSNTPSRVSYSSPTPSTPAGQKYPFRTTPTKSSSRRSVTMKIVDQERTTCLEQSIESPRFVVNNDDSRHEYYDFMISRIDHLLKHSDSEGDSAFDLTPSPSKIPSAKLTRKPDSPAKSIGPETIYINRLAKKYLSSDHQIEAVNMEYPQTGYRRRIGPQNGHNYLPQHGKNRTRAKLLDLDKLKNKPKFT